MIKDAKIDENIVTSLYEKALKTEKLHKATSQWVRYNVKASTQD